VNKTVYILGAGESGVGAAILAKKKGWNTYVSDMGGISSYFKNKLENNEISYEEGKHTEEDILKADLIVKSPGIPEKATLIQKLRKNGTRIESEIEFGYRYIGKAKTIAVTGTNGKTTTTSLIYRIMKDAGMSVSLGGNIGSSFAEQIAEEKANYYVLELSSFQLDDIHTYRPDIAILLNITPDHLDRYNNDFQEYIDSKLRITMNQGPEDVFIYNADDETICSNLKNTKTINKPFTLSTQSGYTGRVNNGKMEITNKENIFTMNISDLGLRGIHNTQNSMAAAISGNVLNIRKENIRESLMNFESIEHRLEFVAKVGGVSYINDSKATNVNSSWYALESIEKPVIWIAGGVDKGNDYKLIEELVQDRVRLIICLGLDNRKIHEAFASKVDMIINTTSAREAVIAASKFAEKDETVLLSPACASFDIFDSYEDRGQQFKEAVRNL